ncbi:MAG: hypothetical protein M1593_02875 [Candidatus Thermoplasmatota archaeon]|jgi:hypothetical protein|nr:hypothetical protein [Candidatus Thermoplasmatota archaeon]MCL5667947.1 hypothetical protein [Candidatus Thermoplasmatota archaeon]
MKLRNRMVIIGNVLIWTVFILGDFVLPRFFNLPLLGYFPFVIFFFFPFINFFRKGKYGNTPASNPDATRRSDDNEDPAADGMNESPGNGEQKSLRYEDFGLSEPERRISWQLIAFILVVVMGVGVLLGRFLL